MFDHHAALTLYRREIDSRTNTTAVNPLLKRILGPIHTRLHDLLLRFISPSELSVTTEGDLGSGSFGSVSAAIWHRKPSLEYKATYDFPVVLKRLKERTSTTPLINIFAKEVRQKPPIQDATTNMSSSYKSAIWDWLVKLLFA
jgi:hypothetical protein